MRSTPAALVLSLGLAAAAASAQSSGPIPRTPDGHPDLQGTYDIASMTPLERAQSTPPKKRRRASRRSARTEYACHEGNDALGNILRGARLREKTTASKER